MEPANETPGARAGSTFMELTRYKYLGESDQSKGAVAPALESPVPAPVAAAAGSGTALEYRLPGAAQARNAATPADVTAAMEGRRSVRSYAPKALSCDELAYLLLETQGVVGQRGAFTLRNVPSAGARHPLETYVLANRVDGVKPGLYRYLALTHRLTAIDTTPGAGDRLTAAFMGQGMVNTGGVTLVWTAVPYRCAWRYGERAYRYVLLDAGHVCQNAYLAAASIGCGCCAMAAFDDAVANEVLGVDGTDEFVIYGAAIGKLA